MPDRDPENGRNGEIPFPTPREPLDDKSGYESPPPGGQGGAHRSGNCLSVLLRPLAAVGLAIACLLYTRCRRNRN